MHNWPAGRVKSIPAQGPIITSETTVSDSDASVLCSNGYKTAFIEADGTRTDSASNLIDEDYRLIDEDGNLLKPALSGPANEKQARQSA